MYARIMYGISVSLALMFMSSFLQYWDLKSRPCAC
jgi:hypothetical protein